MIDFFKYKIKANEESFSSENFFDEFKDQYIALVKSLDNKDVLITKIFIRLKLNEAAKNKKEKSIEDFLTAIAISTAALKKSMENNKKLQDALDILAKNDTK